MFARLSFLLIGFLFLNSVFAQSGLVDSSFGINGVSVLEDVYATSVTIQPDGKLLVGDKKVWDNGVIRFNSNGLVDSSFGVNGMAAITGIGAAVRTLLQPDGKILVSSTFNDIPDAFYIIRLNTDGTFDNSFGAGGKKKVYFTGSFSAYGEGIALQPDGKIVQVGWGADADLDSGFVALVRYNTNGTLDNTFGVSGKVVQRLGMRFTFVFDLALQADGKLIVGGFAYESDITNDPSCFVLMRVNPDGSLDSDFGTSGKVCTYFGAGGSIDIDKSEAYSMRLLSDGKIVLAGNTYQSVLDFGNAIALARYNADGTLDQTYGVGGKAIVGNVGVNYSVKAMAIQPDGKYAIAGWASTGSTYSANDFMVARLHSNGALDSTFGGGILVTPFNVDDRDEAQGLAIQVDGKIVAVGFREVPPSGFHLVAVRYLSGLELGVLNFYQAMDNILVSPNPIEKSATLHYQLSNVESITIDLVDIQGKLVQTFITSEKQEAGKHEQTLNFNEHLSPGHYILRIGNGVSHQAVKIIKQ